MDIFYYKRINNELTQSLQEQKIICGQFRNEILALTRQWMDEKSRRVELEKRLANIVKDFLYNVQPLVPCLDLFRPETTAATTESFVGEDAETENVMQEEEGSVSRESQNGDTSSRSRTCGSLRDSHNRRSSGSNPAPSENEDENAETTQNTLYAINEDEEGNERSSNERSSKSASSSATLQSKQPIICPSPQFVSKLRGPRRRNISQEAEFSCSFREAIRSPPTQLQVPPSGELNSVISSFSNLSIPTFDAVVSSTPRFQSPAESRQSDVVECSASSQQEEEEEECTTLTSRMQKHSSLYLQHSTTLVAQKHTNTISSASSSYTLTQRSSAEVEEEEEEDSVYSTASQVKYPSYERDNHRNTSTAFRTTKENSKVEHNFSERTEHNNCTSMEFRPREEAMSTMNQAENNSKARPRRQCAPVKFEPEDSPQLPNNNASSDSEHSSYERPHRRCAPSVLAEPSLRTKLRNSQMRGKENKTGRKNNK